MQKKGVETNLGYLLKKIFINFLVNFFVFFKKSRQSRTEILTIVSIFKRLGAVLSASRNHFYMLSPMYFCVCRIIKSVYIFSHSSNRPPEVQMGK